MSGADPRSVNSEESSEKMLKGQAAFLTQIFSIIYRRNSTFFDIIRPDSTTIHESLKNVEA